VLLPDLLLSVVVPPVVSPVYVVSTVRLCSIYGRPPLPWPFLY